jgi:hypothetical protein
LLQDPLVIPSQSVDGFHHQYISRFEFFQQ